MKTVEFPCTRCGIIKIGTAYRAKHIRDRPRYCSLACARPVKGDAAQRFWEKVKKSDSCWIWTGTRDHEGYGRFWNNGKMMKAHRWAYESKFGPMPSDQVTLHKCDVPSCVNPDHLSYGTLKENSHDMVKKGRSHWQRLTFVQVEDIKRLVRDRGDVSAIARLMGVSPSTIQAIAIGKTWSHVETCAPEKGVTEK